MVVQRRLLWKTRESEGVRTGDAASLRDAIAIIAGTAVGGGFLALPTVTSPLGLLPTIAGLLGVWFFLALCGVAYAEAVVHALNNPEEDEVSEEDALLDDGDEQPTVSVATVARRSLGDGFSALCSAAFVAQMIAIVTAQVVKSGEILTTVAGVPYVQGCLLCSVLFGAFSFGSRTRVVERANTAMAGAVLFGFAVLVVTTLFGTVGSGTTLSAIVSRLAFADWGPLWPTSSATWVLPVFFNLLCFAQSVPLVAERLGPKRAPEIRLAVLVGSALPLLLCMIWALLAGALLDPASSLAGAGAGPGDPVLRMLTSRFQTSLPVALVAAGAIGTTLVSSYLSLGQFAVDAICQVTGRCSVEDKAWSSTAAVAVPALLACGGPGLYMPMLAFAGAFPTTFLYALLPPVLALIVRRSPLISDNRGGTSSASKATGIRRLLPGGDLLLVVLAVLGTSMLAVSTGLALGAHL